MQAQRTTPEPLVEVRVPLGPYRIASGPELAVRPIRLIPIQLRLLVELPAKASKILIYDHPLERV